MLDEKCYEVLKAIHQKGFVNANEICRYYQLSRTMILETTKGLIIYTIMGLLIFTTVN